MLSHIWLFANPWTAARQVPLSLGLSRQEYWSGLPFPTPEDLPYSGIEPMSSVSPADRFFTAEPPRKPEKTMAFVQSLSNVWLFATPWTAECQAFFSFTVTQSLLKLMSIELVMPSNHLILSPSSPASSIFPSIRIFSHESALCIRWPKYWSFSISPSNEYSGLISFRIGWFYLLALQGTPKSLLQHHNSKES